MDVTTQYQVQPSVEGVMNNPSTDYRYQDYLSGINASNRARYSSYLKSKKVYDIGVMNDNMQYQNLLDDVAKYTKLAQGDYITGLAKTDVNLADALQTATENYGAGNLVGSGIQGARTTEMINDAQMQKEGLLNTEQTTIDKYNTEKDRAKAKFEQVTQPLNELQKPQYRPSGAMDLRQYSLDLLNKSL